MKKGSPGGIADDAFRTGMAAAVALGAVAVGALWAAGVPTTTRLYVVAVGVPFYLVFAAAATNAWLGYGGGALALRPVERAAASGPGVDAEADREGEAADDGLAAAIDDPRSHAAAVGVAAAGAVGLWWVGRPGDAVLAALFAFLVAAFALQASIWPRLVERFDGGGRVAPESAAAVVAATLISGLFLVGVALVALAA